jgi:hypothetical protein
MLIVLIALAAYIAYDYTNYKRVKERAGYGIDLAKGLYTHLGLPIPPMKDDDEE